MSFGREAPSRSIDAVLFDFDGTLADTIPLILASFRYASEKILGAPLSDEALLQNVGVPLAKQMREFAQDEKTADALLAAYREHNHAHHDEMAGIFPGVIEMLDQLRAAGLPLGIVTSKSAPMTARGLTLLGLDGRFGAIVTADDVTEHKPDPMPVLMAAEILGVSPERCAYLGDSPHDIDAALAAGAYAIAATWGVSPRERLAEAGPDAFVESVGDVVPLLARVSAGSISG